MPSTDTLTIEQIELSQYNVRTYRPDAEDTASLEASLLAEGQLNPIAVHPLKGRKNKYGAVAGGRRYRALKALIEAGKLPADQPIKVTIHGTLAPADLIELSIAENLVRKDLRAHELCAGIARAASAHDVAAIAANLGEDPALVAQWLRLGRLAKPVFDAFATGQLSAKQAEAYAATEDTALQEAVFKRLLPMAAPYDIRRALKVGDHVNTQLLEFVGFDAYRSAGGRFEADLFAEDGQIRGRVVDEETLRHLAEARFIAIREDIRRKAGRRDLRFVQDAPRGEFGPDHTLRIDARWKDGKVKLPDGDIVAQIVIDKESNYRIDFWWASRSAKHGHTRAAPSVVDRASLVPGIAIDDRASPGERAKADAAIKEDDGLSQDAIQIMRSQRREILRDALLRDADRNGDVGRDYLIFAQARMLLVGEDRSGTDGASRVGMAQLHRRELGGFELSQKISHHDDRALVRADRDRLLQELAKQSFMTSGDLVEAFLDFRASTVRLKNLAAAAVAGLALERSLNAPGYTVPLHDAVAAQAHADNSEIRRSWQPTQELLELIPKDRRIGLAIPLLNPDELAQLERRKAVEVTDRVLELITHDPDWVHPLLTFTSSEPPIANDADEAEAA